MLTVVGLQRTGRGLAGVAVHYTAVHQGDPAGPGPEEDTAAAAVAAAAGQEEAGLRGRTGEHPVSNLVSTWTYAYSRANFVHVKTNISAKSLWWVSRALVVRRRAVRSGTVRRGAVRSLLLLLSIRGRCGRRRPVVAALLLLLSVLLGLTILLLLSILLWWCRRLVAAAARRIGRLSALRTARLQRRRVW